MCGICGIINKDEDNCIDEGVLRSMNETLRPRGPDDEGYFVSRNVGLGMRRLSIIDVEGGRQPVSNEDGKVQAVVNGEFYNFKEVRRGLEEKGHAFKTKSDSEILPHLYEEYGLKLFSSLNGMFVFAILDSRSKRLILARDRMGKKPLYYSLTAGGLIFGSEIKALLRHPAVNREIDLSALKKYLAYEYVPAPSTIFKNIRKLKPGEYMIYDHSGRHEIRQYWDLEFGRAVNSTDIKAQILERFKTAVERRLVSDVPLGVFLSGGIDSSAVTALAAELAHSPVKTFTIGFDDPSYDESRFARVVSRKFQTEHFEKIFSIDDLLALLPDVAAILDEPFADASILPTYMLSRFAGLEIKVALGGDGGDELFAGYPTFQAERAINLYNRLPKFLREGVLKPLIRRLPVSTSNVSLDFRLKQFIKGADASMPERHITWLGSFDVREMQSLLGIPVDPNNVLEDLYCYAGQTKGFDDPRDQLLYLYQKLYLQDDILAKVDRASMAVGLEVRSPFLDHEFVEFINNIPYDKKLNLFKTKSIFKEALRNRLPSEILNRPKKGFGIPVARWLKSSLKEMAHDLLDESKLRREGFFRPRYVADLLRRHEEGREDNRKKLWTLIIFELWLKAWGGG